MKGGGLGGKGKVAIYGSHPHTIYTLPNSATLHIYVGGIVFGFLRHVRHCSLHSDLNEAAWGVA
jgi:hypothetical protein